MSDTDEPWYKDGLPFTCTRCGHCCTGEPGYVWVTDDDLRRLADHLGEPFDALKATSTKTARGRLSLREKLNGDCVFFEKGAGCTVYPVRPPQCRTWPFWESNLETPGHWERTCAVCPGSGQGELIPAEEIISRLKVIRL